MKTKVAKPRFSLQVIHRHKSLLLLDAVDQLGAQMKQIDFRVQRENTSPFRSHLLIKNFTSSYFIPLSEITYCKAEGNYTRVFTRDHADYLMSSTLKKVERQISKPTFLRCHQSYLVNMKFITCLKSEIKNSLLLNDNINIPISRRKRSAVRDALLNQCRRKG